jgi:hypothetical protein
MFQIFYGNCVHWIGSLNDLVYSIKNLIAGLLIECSLVVQVQEVVYTSKEPLCIKVQQCESLNLCHGSKGPWLEVSFNVTYSAQVLSFCHKEK